jgi:hypothetical protein
MKFFESLSNDNGINEKRSVKHDYFEFKACREFIWKLYPLGQERGFLNIKYVSKL